MEKSYLTKTSADVTSKTTLFFKKTVVLLFAIFSTSIAFGQNDCASAIPITINGACITGDNVTDGTASAPALSSCPTGNFRVERWYTFTVTGGPMNITITAEGNNRNLFLQLISQTGSCTGLAQINCANTTTTNGTQTETINAGSLGNGTYYIKVANVGSAGNMLLNSICVTSPPANDSCSGALTLTSNTTCSATTGSTTGATDNNEVGDCTTGTENSVWYQFQAVAPTHVVTVNGITGFDPVLNVITACGSATAPAGASCVDATNDGGTESLTLTGLTIGAFYKIQIHDYQGDQIANGFTVCVTHTPPPTISSLGATNGCVGGSLTFSGTNLSGATAVTIGGTAATITSNTATSITVTIGTGTTGTVAVTTAGGTATSAASFTVNPLPAAIAGGATAVCTGNVTPAFTNATVGGTWSITNGSGSATITSGGIVTGVSAGTVTVVYTLPTGCIRTAGLTVSQPPGPISGGAATVCTGASTPSFTNPVAGGIWSVTNGTGSATISTGGVVTGVTAGTVTVNYTTASCTPVSFAVNVLAAPAAPTAPVNSAITSTGFTVTWTASAGAINYILEVYTNTARTIPAPGSPFTVASPTVSYTVGGLAGGATYYYQIRATNANCSSSYLLGTVYLPPSNTQCSTATSLPCGTTNLAGSTVGTTSIAHGTTCTMSNYGVWYTFTGDGNQNIISASGSGFDLEMSIASGSCGSLTTITCQDAYTAAGTETYTLNTVLGTTYFVYIAHFGTGTVTGAFTISRTCIIPPTNDDCSGAISLTPTTVCSYTTYNNIGTTASTGMTAPGCANYSGRDVWFSVVVPSTGQIDIDTQTGSLTDSGVAFYTGSCGSLALLDCDDDSSSNGAMSYLTRTGLTPGQTIYVRVWGFGGATGTFGICATTPSCPSPSDLNAAIVSTTSVTVSWPPTTPPASGGYQYFINTTGVAPTAGTTPTGTTGAGVTGIALNGLTPGQKYYFWVRSFCGGSDVSSWFGPTNYTPCNVGNGNGTTTLSCPSVATGGINGSAPPGPMNCSALSCIDLEASYLQVNQPTNYTVTQITDPPPYQFTCLQNPVSVNIDDVWSPMINLPFNFCFYGNNYNRCLIGSNGVITFDTTTYSPGGRNEWEFFNNLPNTNLLRNTIFGVYHDIDPSKGGQVGWELITLNSGCRALVASWNDIPMYSNACNSQLYTGMIVLYENTNVIDVYIKEKNVCGTWNDGNAIVGIQNAAGNAAVVAPNRNALDANWTVTNEAWRFTPSGSSLTTIQWFEGNPTTGTPISSATPVTVGDRTTSRINVCPTTTTTYSAQVTYARCNGNITYSDNVIITINGNKVWNGLSSNDWNVGTNWTPNGVPTSANCVIIPTTSRNPVISNTPNAVGYNLAVYNGAQLTMNPNQNLIITDRVLVQPSGIFTINNNSNLVQINNTAANSGNIFYKRIAPNIKGSDYVYWSSPVLNQNMGTIYDSGSQGYRYQWNTTVNNNNGAGGNMSQGNWEAASGTMAQARGYIIRGSSNFNQAAGNIPTTFNGVPSNGIIPYTIQRGVYTGAPYNGSNGVQITNLNDNYNLLGNPYPSSMNALAFLQANTYNASTNPSGTILGNVKLWTHGTDPLLGVVNPFYGSYLYNYDSNDYLTLNYLGSTTPGVTDIIRSGQAFFVQMVDGSAGSGNVTFNNSMRYDGSNLPYTNSGFFKNGNTPNTESVLERHRIWLDIVDANSQSSGILVGYATDATNSNDSLFDAPTAIPGSMKLFSMIDNENDIFDIQGRSLPFDVNDEIPIGIKAPAQGNYTFAIAAVDGLFENQNIYIKDNLLNIIHDLKANPYHFTTISGVISDRFKIVYSDGALGITDHSFDENTVKVISNDELAVSSSNLEMESIAVFNLLGQKLDTFENVNSNYVILSNLHKDNATLLLKIKLQTGETVTRKIIF